jgi:hypothetical protein
LMGVTFVLLLIGFVGYLFRPVAKCDDSHYVRAMRRQFSTARTI